MELVIRRARTEALQVRFAAAGTRRPWMMKQKMRSPCYTTRWQDLKRVGN